MEHPKRIGKYELLDYLGGGMSQVYRARDTLIGRIVCVKILGDQGTSDAEAKARFLQEARVAGNLYHDNVIRVYDFGEDDQGHPFMVMEFIEGDDLRNLIRNGRTGDLEWKLKAALQIARSIEHIHSRKIIHRDIKPENIHVTQQGVVKLMDFGIAKSEDVSLTKTGFTLGTPYYMAPEQVRGQSPTQQMDIYAYGVLLFELLAGIRATDGETIETIFYKILYEPLNLAPLDVQQVPAVVRELVQRCTEKEPAKRPQNFGEVCQVLESLLGDRAPKVENAAPPSAAGASATTPMAAAAGAETAPSIQAAKASTPRPMPSAGARVATPPASPTLAGATSAVPGQTPTPVPFQVVESQPARSKTPVMVLGLVAILAIGGAVGVYFWKQGQGSSGPPATLSTPSGEMVLVPAGPFLSGKARTPVTLPAFYIDKTEVTNGAYQTFCAERKIELPVGFPANRPELPVINVTFNDAQDFARWAGKRLPTLQEWEKAARGLDGRPYPWGAEADVTRANLRAAAVQPPQPLQPAVSFQAGAGPFGTLNLLGNAWEWVDDRRKPSAAVLEHFRHKVMNPPPSETEPWYAIRGGAFDVQLSEALVWDSASVPARYHDANIGFRCVKEVETK